MKTGTNREQIVIVGAGGHAECVAALIEEENRFEIIGMLDNAKTGRSGGYPILGGDEQLEALKARNVKYAFVGAVIGDKVDTRVGRNIYRKITGAGFEVPNLVSSRSLIRKDARVGDGLLVAPFALIDVGAQVGNGVVVNPRVIIGHHCKVADFAVFAGGATLNARLNIGEGAFIGMGAAVYASVGSYAKVAPGTVVMQEVPDGHMAFGNPMRMTKLR